MLWLHRVAESAMTDGAELAGQGSGTGDARQDVGSPAKKMRMGSGLAHARDAGDASFASAEKSFRHSHYLYLPVPQRSAVCCASVLNHTTEPRSLPHHLMYVDQTQISWLTMVTSNSALMAQVDDNKLNAHCLCPLPTSSYMLNAFRCIEGVKPQSTA